MELQKVRGYVVVLVRDGWDTTIRKYAQINRKSREELPLKITSDFKLKSTLCIRNVASSRETLRRGLQEQVINTLNNVCTIKSRLSQDK